MIIRCHVCSADPDRRWKSPPAMIFHDTYREDGSARDDPLHACRDHLENAPCWALRGGALNEPGRLRVSDRDP
jgi:hypothetical protein